MRSPYFTEAHDVARQSIRQFVESTVVPNAPLMEREGRVPGFLWQELGKNGHLSLGHDEAFGGKKSDIFDILILVEEMARTGLGGFCEAFLTHTHMVLSFISKFGNRFIKRNYLAPGIAGQKIGAMALIDPPVASEMDRLKMSARPERQHYCLEGSISFVSNGGNADFFVVAARTEPYVHPGGISLFVVDKNLPGVRIHPTHAVGWHSADLAEVYFENVKVSGIQMLGQENMGLYYLNECYLLERLLVAATAITQADYCLESTLRYIHHRQYHRPGIFPASRHSLASMASEIEAVRQLVYYAAWLYEEGLQSIKQGSMAKLLATEVLKKIADQCVQFIGKNAMRENSLIASLFRDAHMGTLSHGGTETMREIIAKLLIDSQSPVATPPFLSSRAAPGDPEASPVREEEMPQSGAAFSPDAHPGFPEPAAIPDLAVPEKSAAPAAEKSAEGPTPTAAEISGSSGEAVHPAPVTAPPADAPPGLPPESPGKEPPAERPGESEISAAEPGATAKLPPENAPRSEEVSAATTAQNLPPADPELHHKARMKSGYAQFAEDMLSEDEEESDDLDSDIIAAMERAFARQQKKLKESRQDQPAKSSGEMDVAPPVPPGEHEGSPPAAPAGNTPAEDRPAPAETGREPGPVIVRQPSRTRPPESRELPLANGEPAEMESAQETALSGATEPEETSRGKDAAQTPAASPENAIRQGVYELMYSLPERFDAEKAAGFSAVIHYRITDSGETYSVIVENGQCRVVAAPAGQPTCIVKTSAQTLVDMETGKINPQVAFMMGRIEISHVPQLMQFVKLFRKTVTA